MPRRARAFAVALIAILAAPPLVIAQAESARVTVPGGVAAFSDALDLHVDPGRLIPELTRRLLDVRARANTAARLRDYLQKPPAATPDDHAAVPLPLVPALWSTAVFGRTVASNQLFAEIVNDREASLLTTGLLSVDRETLAYLEAYPDLVSRLYRKHAAIVAAFSRSLRIVANRVTVPGGPHDEGRWEHLVGATISDPAAFVDRLYTADEGRLAYFFDAVDRLTDVQRRSWVGPNADDLARLYRAFERTVHDWDRTVDPFARVPFDGAILMTEIVPGPELTALDAMQRLADAAPNRRREVFQHLAYVSRAGAGRARLDTSFPRYPALYLTLERMGIAGGPAVDAAVQRAEWIDSLGGSRQIQALSLFQGTLAILDRARLTRSLSREQAEDLVASLSRLEPANGRDYATAFAAWLETALLPGSADAWEDGILRLMSGRTAQADAPIVIWEDRQYILDLGASELARLRAIRARQEGTALDVAMKTRRSDQLAVAVRSLAYTPHLGDASDAGLWNGDLSSRHDFGQILKSGADRRMMRWRAPIEHVGRGVTWHVEGSLLGLDIALARLALRRRTLEPPASQPTPHRR